MSVLYFRIKFLTWNFVLEALRDTVHIVLNYINVMNNSSHVISDPQFIFRASGSSAIQESRREARRHNHVGRLPSMDT